MPLDNCRGTNAIVKEMTERIRGMVTKRKGPFP
jgi:hypothetical protein